ncbi:protein windpipe [Lucilia cuprina]|uniref:protein windpipe n=1 Tax=Lucilia cuprina TaxID=7375 RepID=UPI000C719079|nr:protein windpipe [Lucilia cuprina]XP_023302221.1 protein windpipe [Lucilia cuprina]XP_046809613.1 protein windpipe [Lucilia cuprina]KAI8128590.1 Protein windpipe [Lucilia cuprina]
MTSPTTTRQSYKLSLTLLSLLLCSMVVATPTAHTTTHAVDTSSSSSPVDLKADENYLCPEDCHCVLAHNTHKPFLHAKCTSLKGLQSEKPLEATLPVHSIDLSFLNLTRLAKSLEKLHDLTSIDLSHNELHEIGHLGRRIKKLNLKHNRINSSKLSKMPQHVQSLNLQHNDITNLPLEFTKLTQLQSLELAHNQINCSCETLEVRNWLQERHVFMEHPVKCFYPTLYKGKSWLQVKQSAVCEKEKRLGYNAAEEEENELMMGDQPFEASGDEVQDEEELGKDFMPIDSNTKKTTSAQNSALTMLNEVEGSGDLSEMNLPLDMLDTSTNSAPVDEVTTDMPEEDDEGSGSGGGMLFIPAIHREHVITDDFDIPESKEEDDGDLNEDDMNDNKPIEEPAVDSDVFRHNLGIFDGDEKPRPSTEEPEVEEEEIKPVVVPTLGEGNEPSTDGPETDAVAHAKMGETKDDSNATYFLLGVIGLIVIGLLLYVAIKRCKHSSHRNDPENPQTELVDMDKKQLGKPLRNGVPEHVPLIGEKTKSDMAKPINGSKPYDGDTKDGPNQNEPLLNKNGNANGNGAAHADEPEDSRPGSQLQAPHEYYPISPRYPPPQSPRASKYSQQPQQAEQNNNDPNQPYLPSSPKSGRYSPVYSPETGRVKIKLSETPRPKTPMLVTRSRSNAGDIITTPVRPSQMESFQATPVHTAATNGHAVGDH